MLVMVHVQYGGVADYTQRYGNRISCPLLGSVLNFRSRYLTEIPRVERKNTLREWIAHLHSVAHINIIDSIEDIPRVFSNVAIVDYDCVFLCLRSRLVILVLVATGGGSLTALILA